MVNELSLDNTFSFNVIVWASSAADDHGADDVDDMMI